ncbi:Egg cell-secreted protein 1.1 [Glycine soja]|nr:Egg cell-secreted protein 1.1 [Glycine max]
MLSQKNVGEVVMFFLNGETYLGPSCCQAIKISGHDCWPNMLASVGFTSEEGDILQGYCDTEQEQLHSPPSPTSPTTVVHGFDDATTKVLPP